MFHVRCMYFIIPNIPDRNGTYQSRLEAALPINATSRATDRVKENKQYMYMKTTYTETWINQISTKGISLSVNHSITSLNVHYHMSRRMGKATICIGENKGADQLRGNREAD